MTRLLVAASAALATVAAAGSASAQTSQVLGRSWEDVVTGRGLKVGEATVMHPVAGIETGIVNNVFYQDQDTVTAGLLRVAGEVAFASLPPQRLEDPERTSYPRPPWQPWRGSIYRSYGGPYWGDLAPASENPGAPPRMIFRAGARVFWEQYLSGRQDVRAQSALGLNGNLHLDMFPYELFAFAIDDDLTRDIHPTNFESSEDLNRWINQLRLGVRLQPGGKAIVPELRFQNRIDYFESTGSQFANRLDSTVGLRVNWWLARFTKFFADASLGFFSGLDSGNPGLDKVSSHPLRIMVGANTALSELLAIQAHAGFAKGFYAAGPDFTGPVVGARLTYRYSPFGQVSGGYNYEFADSINANFYTEHVLDARVVQQLEARVLLEGRASGILRHYDGVPMDLGGGSRDDFILTLAANGKYVLREWLDISATVQAVSDQTDFRYLAGTSTDDPSYNRLEVFAGVNAAY